MELRIAKLIVEASEYGGSSEEDTLHLRETYSGRCMYGKGTAGVVGNKYEYFTSVAAVAKEMVEEMPDIELVYDTAEDVERFLIAALACETDSMGYDVIWY